MPDQQNPANENTQVQSSQNQQGQSQNQNVGQQRSASEEAEIQEVINQVAGNATASNQQGQPPQQPGQQQQGTPQNLGGQQQPQQESGQPPPQTQKDKKEGVKTSAPKPVVEETSAPPPPTPPTMDPGDGGGSGGLPPLPPDGSQGDGDGDQDGQEDEAQTEDPGSKQAPGDIPPVVSGPSKSKKGLRGKKLVATILGVLFLVGGIGAGVYLVQQQQDIREEAYLSCRQECLEAGNTPTECSGLPSCPESPPSNGNACKNAGGECFSSPNCNSLNRTIVNGGNGCGNPSQICCSASGPQQETPTSPPDSVNACDRSAPNVAPGPDGRYCTDKTFGSSCQTRDGQSGSCQPIGDPTQGTQVECKCAPGAQTPTTTPISEEDTNGGPPPSGPSLSAQCLNIQAYDTEGDELTADDLAAMDPGDTVRFAVSGNTNSGSIDMARFTINGTQRPSVSQKLPGTNLFYDEYTIPEGQTSFSINAQLHHTNPDIGWF